MCWACQEDELRAAYRDYLAQRAAQARQAPESGDELASRNAGLAKPDWAKGAWFAAEVEPQE